jgi:hypothetical protein
MGMMMMMQEEMERTSGQNNGFQEQENPSEATDILVTTKHFGGEPCSTFDATDWKQSGGTGIDEC